jgi:branched-chain amino acid transport system ATP-binding protein
MLCRLKDKGLSILLVEQKVRDALMVADRGYIFENGLIKMSDTAVSLLNNNEIKKIYLGG